MKQYVFCVSVLFGNEIRYQMHTIKFRYCLSIFLIKILMSTLRGGGIERSLFFGLN